MKRRRRGEVGGGGGGKPRAIDAQCGAMLAGSGEEEEEEEREGDWKKASFQGSLALRGAKTREASTRYVGRRGERRMSGGKGSLLLFIFPPFPLLS